MIILLFSNLGYHLEPGPTQQGVCIHVSKGSPFIFLRPVFTGATGTAVLYIAGDVIS